MSLRLTTPWSFLQKGEWQRTTFLIALSLEKKTPLFINILSHQRQDQSSFLLAFFGANTPLFINIWSHPRQDQSSVRRCYTNSSFLFSLLCNSWFMFGNIDACVETIDKCTSITDTRRTVVCSHRCDYRCL